MKRWMQSAAVGAAAITFGSLLVCRSGARVGSAQSPDEGLAHFLRSDPDPVNTALMARNCAKHRIAGELIAGRLTLLEAAAAFRDADAYGPATMLMTVFPDAPSLDDAYCRSVLSYVGQQAPPDLRETLTHDLETELSTRLRDGTLRLPDP